MTRVLVADDDPLTAAGIEMLLANSNFEIVGIARSGTEVLDALAAARAGRRWFDQDRAARSPGNTFHSGDLYHCARAAERD